MFRLFNPTSRRHGGKRYESSPVNAHKDGIILPGKRRFTHASARAKGMRRRWRCRRRRQVTFSISADAPDEQSCAFFFHRSIYLLFFWRGARFRVRALKSNAARKFTRRTAPSGVSQILLSMILSDARRTGINTAPLFTYFFFQNKL